MITSSNKQVVNLRSEECTPIKQTEVNLLHLSLYYDRTYTGMCVGRSLALLPMYYFPSWTLFIPPCRHIYYYRGCSFQLSKVTSHSIY